MQEEVENKSVAISIKATKLTANVLKAALLKALAEMEKKQKNPKVYKGKQSVKHLVRQGAGVSNIEITDGNIKSFEKVARKYGVDFALKKDVSTQPPRYLVFFKSKLPIRSARCVEKMSMPAKGRRQNRTHYPVFARRNAPRTITIPSAPPALPIWICVPLPRQENRQPVSARFCARRMR